MGDTNVEHFRPNPERTYVNMAPFGSMDAKERIELLAAENLQSAVLYPTIGILWEAELSDNELTQAYCRAYNRWIADFCRDSHDKLVPIAHLSLGDPEAAAKELERAVADGCRGAFVMPFTWSKKAHGHPDHDPVFAACQDLDVPLALHPGFEPIDLANRRFKELRKARLLITATAGDGVRHAFTTFFDYGVFDRFPKFKLVVLESGAGWIGYWLDRMDAVFGGTVMGTRVPLKDRPSEYFKRRCWISADPDERTIAALTELIGPDRFFWASDYPHADHPGDYLANLTRMVAPMSPHTRNRVLGDNCRELYRIDV